MTGGVTASYVYDADGNRVKETIGPTFGHELHESKRKGPGIRENSCNSWQRKLGGFLPRIARIETKTEARFVKISEIRGRESRADF